MSAVPSNAVQANPYGAPRAAVDDAKEEYQPVRIFAVSGRIGRARYITYSVGVSFLIMFIAGLLAALLGPVGTALSVIAWIGVVVVSIMLTVQRCHDFDTTGWLALLALIPLANLIFWFIPGTDGRNRFGAKTPPNSVGVLIAVWILPVLFVVGIVAAVSIPAYQQYVMKAKQQQVK
jgi:uncharacterized membrane protein YhaH (DUF805 family)